MIGNEVVIVSAARTPFDKFGGPMKGMTTVQLASIAAKAAMKNAQLDPKDVEEFYLGINMPTQNRSIARQAALEAGIPEKELIRIHAPIGLPILGETPAEIAISIAAELILHRAKQTEGIL